MSRQFIFKNGGVEYTIETPNDVDVHITAHIPQKNLTYSKRFVNGIEVAPGIEIKGSKALIMFMEGKDVEWFPSSMVGGPHFDLGLSVDIPYVGKKLIALQLKQKNTNKSPNEKGKKKNPNEDWGNDRKAKGSPSGASGWQAQASEQFEKKGKGGQTGEKFKGGDKPKDKQKKGPSGNLKSSNPADDWKVAASDAWGADDKDSSPGQGKQGGGGRGGRGGKGGRGGRGKNLVPKQPEEEETIVDFTLATNIPGEKLQEIIFKGIEDGAIPDHDSLTLNDSTITLRLYNEEHKAIYQKFIESHKL